MSHIAACVMPKASGVLCEPQLWERAGVRKRGIPAHSKAADHAALRKGSARVRWAIPVFVMSADQQSEMPPALPEEAECDTM